MMINEIISTIKKIVFVLALIAAVWFYKDYGFQKSEKERQTENNNQLRAADSLKFTSQLLSKDEIKDYLLYQNKALAKRLQESNINPNRIQSIVSGQFQYRDDTLRSSDISNIISAVRKNIPGKSPFIDSTGCMIIRGFVRYENDSMKVDVAGRTFKNKSDAVAYWERREWKFLGIKTRFFGKKQFTSKSFDECGETKILKIEKKQP